MQALMEKCMSLLDNQIHNFKMELEANNSGVTEVIEKSKNKCIISF